MKISSNVHFSNSIETTNNDSRDIQATIHSRKRYEIAFVFLNQTASSFVLINRSIMQEGKRNMCSSARSARHRERNKETLLLEWQKSGARGRGSVISLLPDHHRSPRRSNWVRKEGTSSANTSLAMPSFLSTSFPPTLVLARSPNLWLKKVPDYRSRSLYL